MLKAINENDQHTTWRSIVSVWIGAFILLIPAFINGFPFLYADTGTYLVGGFKGIVSEIRPITYGVFLRHASLMESFWLVAFLQAIIVSWSVHIFYRAFSSRSSTQFALLSIGILTLMTGLGEVTGMLMPDIFSATMILGGAILLFGKRLPRWQTISLHVLLWFSVAAHHSNAYVMLFTLAILGATMLFNLWKKREQPIVIRRFLAVMTITLIGFFTIPILHWTYSGEFYWSKAKSVFLTNRINQMGLLQPFLRDHCDTETYNLCGAIDQIPFDFLWDPASPMNKTGGMAVNDPFYGEMLRGFFSDPRYVKLFLIKSIENGVIQFFNYEGKVIFKEIETGYPFQVMQEILPEFIPPIKRTVQYADQWSSRTTQLFQRFLVLGSFLFLISVFLFRRPAMADDTSRRVFAFLLVALAANAFICGGISMVDMRFQYRIIWLIPLFALTLLSEHVVMRRKFIEKI